MKRTVRTVVGLCLWALLVLPAVPVLAEEAGGAEGPAPGEKPGRERQRRPNPEKMLRRIVKDLGLTEEQVAKLRDLKKQEAEQLRALRQEQEKAIEGILNEEQLGRYREMREKARAGRPGAGRPGAGRPGAGRGGRRRPGNPVEVLRQISGDLGLSEEQKQKLGSLAREARGSMLDIIEQARASGDFGSVREKVEALQKDLVGKARELLTDDQRRKFDAYLQGGREALRRLDGERGGRPSPEQAKRRRLAEIQQRLALQPEEAMILMPKIEDILEAQSGLQGRLRDQRRQVEALLGSEEADETAVMKELEHFRKMRQDEQAAIEKLQEALRELLTLRQEAVLVLFGVLK